MKKIKFLYDGDRPIFSCDAEQQRKELAESDVLRIYRENREEIICDDLCPQYHFVAPVGFLHDPNGLCYWQGKWHLFYQHVYNATSAEGLVLDSSICWGHAVSEDLIHWEDLPDALYPGQEDACWSGAVLVEEDRAVASYFGHNAGIVVAISRDPLLLNWEKVGVVIPLKDDLGNPAPCPVFDPCIFKEGEYYYILSGSSEYVEKSKRLRRQEYLFRSKDLCVWEYRHPFVVEDNFGKQGDDGACPYFVDIGEGEDRKKLLVHFSHIAGSKYAVGLLNSEQETFSAIGGGKFSSGGWMAGGLHAPSCCAYEKGSAVVLFNMNNSAPNSYPIMSLPQTMTLSGSVKDEIDIDVVEGVRSLRGHHVTTEPMTLHAGEEYSPSGISGNCVEIRLEANVPYQRALELKVLCSPDRSEYATITVFRNTGIVNRDLHALYGFEGGQNTMVTLDTTHVGGKDSRHLPIRPPEICSIPLFKDELVVLDIFIDKCILEVFVNGKRSILQSVYPSVNARDISIAAVGGDVEILSLEKWDMKSIYPNNTI